MSYIIPDPRFEMPALLTPREKPFGETVVNYENPIASRGFTAAYLFDDYTTGTGVSQVTKGLIPNDPFGGFAPFSGGEYTARGFKSIGNRNCLRSENLLSNVYLRNSTLILVFRRVAALPDFGYIMYWRTFQNYSLYAVPGGVNWTANGQVTTPTVPDEDGSATKGPIRVCAMTHDGGGDGRIMVDGNFGSPATSNTLVGSGSAYLSIGARWDSDLRYSSAEVEAMFFFSRELPDVELRSIGYDPYQLVMPA